MLQFRHTQRERERLSASQASSRLRSQLAADESTCWRPVGSTSTPTLPADNYCAEPRVPLLLKVPLAVRPIENTNKLSLWRRYICKINTTSLLANVAAAADVVVVVVVAVQVIRPPNTACCSGGFNMISARSCSRALGCQSRWQFGTTSPAERLVRCPFGSYLIQLVATWSAFVQLCAPAHLPPPQLNRLTTTHSRPATIIVVYLFSLNQINSSSDWLLS